MDTNWIASLVPNFLAGLGGIAVGVGVFLHKMGKYQNIIDNLQNKMKDVSHKIELFGQEVAVFNEFKRNTQKYIDNQIYEKKSPLQLTLLGKELIEKSGFKEIFEQTKNDLSNMLEKKINDKKLKTKYDIQEEARDLMDSLVEYPSFSSIKKYAFDNGQDMAQILRAGSILLRDYYFSIHPEIKN